MLTSISDTITNQLWGIVFRSSVARDARAAEEIYVSPNTILLLRVDGTGLFLANLAASDYMYQGQTMTTEKALPIDRSASHSALAMLRN